MECEPTRVKKRVAKLVADVVATGNAKAAEPEISFDLNPPPLVEDPERFYRSGVK
jgi:hypothetical protein